ncbi:hypothetical protein SDC9_147600 [bioreactor metagenome]|uniref:Teneurin-like YD-shell domain-containing protein n=1 Tax=bioreactor metagenome TaxID=1076179 RepID=A0A645EG45_9ZZZZ
MNSNALLRQYAWQPESVGLDVPLTLKIGNNVYYYHSDANKNIIALTDSTETVVKTYRYSSFGQVISTTGTIENPFQFSSEYFDAETGLVYYNYRYYNLTLGRWISKDPIRAFNEEFLKSLLGLGEVSTCFSKCMEKSDLSNLISIGGVGTGGWLANNGISKELLGVKVMPGASPTAYQPLKLIVPRQTWIKLGKLGIRTTIINGIRVVGTIFMGAYDGGRLFCCLKKCRGL